MKKDVDYIIEQGSARRRRLSLQPVFTFFMSALFTALIISSVQYIDGDRSSKTDSKVKIIDGIETEVSDFVELSSVSEGHKLEVEETPPVSNETAQPSEIPSVGGKRIVYLTFDDGPSGYTSKLLDVLKKYNIKATFFVTCRGSDEMILREANEGHTVALHTCSHDYEIYRSTDTYFNDLNAVSARVARITGKSPKIIRFPGGASNSISTRYNKGIMTTLTSEVEKRGYRYFDWNVSSGDASNNVSTTDAVYRNVVNAVNGRGDGSFSVVLQHDTKDFSVNAVEKIIQYGLKNGYEFKTLDENSPTVHHRVNN